MFKDFLDHARRCDLTATGLAVLAALHAKTNRSGYMAATVQEIADLSGVKRRAVYYALPELKAKGAIDPDMLMGTIADAANKPRRNARGATSPADARAE